MTTGNRLLKVYGFVSTISTPAPAGFQILLTNELLLIPISILSWFSHNTADPAALITPFFINW